MTPWPVEFAVQETGQNVHRRGNGGRGSRYPLAISCGQPVLAAVGYGTLNRNSTLYSAGASAGIGGSYLVIVEMTTVCIPATADTYQSHIGAVVTTNLGAAVVPLTASPAVVINCALF